MMIDIPNERGMADADLEFGDSTQCTFPLFSFIKPFEIKYMILIYGVMFMGIAKHYLITFMRFIHSIFD